MAKVYIGTSGWQYPDFSELFYPRGVEKNEQLTYYSRKFNSVEINNTFYHLPKEDSVKRWYEQVAEKFVFSIKASRYITHMKNLMDPEETLPNFYERIGTLRDKCGPILFQLPPRWQINQTRFAQFLQHLPKENRHVFEFRNPTWLKDDIYDLLEKHRAAFCIYDINYKLSPLITTTDFVYIRLHGPGKAYQDPYDLESLKQWGNRIQAWLESDLDVYCYFDNTYQGHAWENARNLQSIISN